MPDPSPTEPATPPSTPRGSSRDWASAPIDPDFLLDSGLLFEVNRQFLHPLGIGLTVRVGKDGEKTWGFKDMRADPGALTFDPGTLEVGRRKFVRFMAGYGAGQMRKRERRLGQSVQHVEPSWQ